MTNAYEELKANRDAHEARRDRVKNRLMGRGSGAVLTPNPWLMRL